MGTGVREPPEPQFAPIHVEALDCRTLPIDLYIRHNTERHPVLYRAAGVPFTLDDAARLLEQGVEYLYISSPQYGMYRRLLVERLHVGFQNEAVPRPERVRQVRTVCRRAIEDAINVPGGDAVETVAAISRTFADFADADLDSFGYLLEMSSHDFCTATHMINVGVGCGILLREFDPRQRSLLPVLVQGGLLHDIGKRSIPVEVLQKEGKLAPAEWKVLREHPRIGHAELSRNPQVPMTVLEMARDHHERIDGMGYPAGRRGDQISLSARICAVVDVFDAITAARPYRQPTPALDALAIMEEGLGTHFDPDVFASWQHVVRRMVASDPARAFPAASTPIRRALSAFIPVGYLEPAPGSSEAGSADDHANIGRGNRRGHKRFLCKLTVRAMFTRQGKPGTVETEQWFDARIVDVSRRGLRLETPWPLSIGDVLVVELVNASGELVSKSARVVRPGRRVNGRWHSGLSFAGEAQAARAA